MLMWVFFNCFFDVEPANVMFEVCLSAAELGAYFSLCEKNSLTSHHDSSSWGFKEDVKYKL